MTRSSGSGVVLAVLLNPPEITPGTRTRNAVALAAKVLGYESVTIANLSQVATPSVIELNEMSCELSWLDARPPIVSALHQADGVLAAWGIAGMSGAGRRVRQAQADWLASEALAVGISSVWTVGGEPRHPSRWHQYVSDRHGRTTGGTFEQRLAQVLERVQLLAST